MYRKFSACAFLTVAGIAHHSERLPGGNTLTYRKSTAVGRQMCIIKIATGRAADPDAPAAKRKPAHLFHDSVRHAHDLIVVGNIRRRHKVTAFMPARSAISALKHPRVLIPHPGITYRRTVQIIPYRRIGIPQPLISRTVFTEQVLLPRPIFPCRKPFPISERIAVKRISGREQLSS